MNTTTNAEATALQTVGQAAMVDTARTQATSLMMDVATMESLMRVADLMASGKSTIPKHLQDSPADCMAVVMQSMQWGMNPFAVAQKTHLVSGTLGYEAQLVNAVVQQSGAIEGRFHYEYKGVSPNLECRVGAKIRGESEVVWGGWLNECKVTTKNSPLWKTNAAQQLGYLQVKNWTRLYCPGAILGVYTPDELQDSAPGSRDMGAAEVLQPTIDVTPYLMGAKVTKTDADAAAYWKEHNGKFAKQAGDHQALKDTIIAHRLAMKNARTVDMETGEIKQATAPAAKTFDDVMAGLCGAKSMDELYVWGEWIETIADNAMLAAKFDEMKNELEEA